MRDLELYYTNTDRFEQNKGFMIAMALSDAEGKTKPIPLEYGALKIYRKEWSSEGWTKFKPIKTRLCTQNDFNYAEAPNPEALFYETKTTVEYLKNFKDSLLCPDDPDQLYNFGNF